MSLRTHIKSYFLLLFTKKKSIKFDIKKTKKILFFRYDRIGDMIITTPVFRELKLKHPNIKITVLASKTNQEVLKSNPYVDEIVVNYKNNLIGNLTSLIKLKKQNFDACVEFDHSVVPHAIIRLKIINPKIVISVLKEGRYGVNGNDLELYDFYTEKKQNTHFRDIWLATLSPFGIKSKSNHYDLFYNQYQSHIAKNFVNKFYNNFLIGINLEGAVKGKRIKFEDFKNICKGIYNSNYKIRIIVFSPPHKYQSVKEMISKMNLGYVIQSYKTNTILDLAALIDNMDLIISPDTSVVHIASTYNKPIVTIHENNIHSYKLFAPTSKLSRTVFSKSKNSLVGFSVNDLITYCLELIQIKKQ